MVTELQKELIEIGKLIDEGKCSYGELAYLQAHKQAVLNYGDAHLCEQAGITEEEYNKGELNPDLVFEESFIKLEFDTNNDGIATCTIVLDDGQKLSITEDELIGLNTILRNHYSEIEEYYHQAYERFKDLY